MNSRAALTQRNEEPSQIQKLLVQVNQIDEKLTDAKALTGNKFKQLND